MATSDKNILITPNTGATADPVIAFSGANASVGAQTIYARMYPTNSGTLSFEGSAGQLFSVTNNLTGTIFAVGDVSGIPSIEVLDTGAVKLAQYSGNVLIGTGTDAGTGKLQIAGTIAPSADNTYNVGTASYRFATVYGVTFSGTSTTAKYADLAERYTSDAEYPPGTVVVFGGEKEITISTQSHDSAIAGVISTDPAYLMNSELEGSLPVALVGRVPCQVLGPVRKGQTVVSSSQPGVARALDKTQYEPGCIIGKALENIDTETIETIEVVVGRI